MDKFGWIWAKSKPCIPKNNRSSMAMISAKSRSPQNHPHPPIRGLSPFVVLHLRQIIYYV